MLLTVKVNSEENLRVDKLLSKELNISRTKIQSLIKNKKVYINNNLITSNDYLVKIQDEITCFEEETQEKKEIKPFETDLDIIYEDEDLIILNKRAGICVHPGISNHDNTLVNALIAKNISLSSEETYINPGIVHRLDKDTSGLMIVAKNDKMHEKISEQIKNREVKRKYKAVVFGIPSKQEGTVTTNIAKDRNNKRLMKVQKFSGKKAITHYKLIEVLANKKMSLVECELETGRTHQIRVHMNYIGNSIVGDQLYGKNDKKVSSILNYMSNEYLKTFKRQALHSFYIKFFHPSKNKYMEFEIDLPADIKRILKVT